MRVETISKPVAVVRLKNRIEQLDYIGTMIRELRAMTEGEHLEMLTLHLEMAYIEASDQLRELRAQQDSATENGKKPTGTAKAHNRP